MFSLFLNKLKHIHSEGRYGLEDMSIQLIDWVKGERELREKEGQWIYKLTTLRPQELSNNVVFLYRIKSHASMHAHVNSNNLLCGMAR